MRPGVRKASRRDLGRGGSAEAARGDDRIRDDGGFAHAAGMSSRVRHWWPSAVRIASG